MLLKHARLLIVSLFLPLLTIIGCSSSQPFIPVAQYTSDTALFLYSPLQVRNGHEVPVIHINGEEVTRLANGALTVVNLQPGLHEITLYKMETPFAVASQAFYAATFTIEQGERLYFRWQEDKSYDVSLTADSFAGPMDYRFVPAQIASTELSEAKIKTVTVLPVRAPLES